MSNDGASIIAFSCEGKKGEFKTMTGHPQCFFKGKRMVYDNMLAEVQMIVIGTHVKTFDVFCDKENLGLVTAQPFETICIMAQLKCDCRFDMSIVGVSKHIKRVEIEG